MTEWYIPSTPATSEDRVVRRIKRLERRVDRATRTPQLPNSAIDDGSVVVTVNGQTTAIIGMQYDGTTTAASIAGPIPPVPDAPIMTTAIGGVSIKVPGTFPKQTGFTEPVVAPMDFARYEVQVSADVNFAFDVRSFHVVSANGGTISVTWAPAGTPLYARVRTWTESGKFSAPSLKAGPVNSGQVGLTDLGFDISTYTGGTQIYYTTGAAPTAPTGGFKTGDMWLKQTGTATGVSGGPPAGTPIYETYRWTGSAWVLLEAQGISSSLAAAIAAQQAADSKLKQFSQSTAPTYTGAANTALWIDTSTAGGNRIMIWSGTAWVPRTLGNGAITPNSLVASNVIATGTITAALLETLLVLSTTVVAGNPNGTHTRMTPTGLRVYAADPVDNVPNEVIRLGTDSNDYFGVTDSSGRLVSSMDAAGGANFQSLSVTKWPVVAGRRLDTVINEGPRGLVALGQDAQLGAPFTAEQGVFEIRFKTEAGRAYRVSVGGFAAYAEDAGAEIVSRVRYTQNGTAPTVSSAILNDWSMTPSMIERPVPVKYDIPWYAGNLTGTARLLLTMGRGAGTGRVIIPTYAPLVTLTVEDIGPAVGFAQIISSGSGGTGGGATPAPQRTIVEYGAAWSTTYQGNNVARTDTTDCIQGYTDYFPTGGNHGSLIGWGSLSAELTGATIEKIEVWLYSNHWYFNSGGTAYIGSHAAGASPGTFEQGNPDNIVANPGWVKPGGKWIDITNFGAGFANNTIRGISIGRAPDTALGYYGRFDGAFGAQPPTLRIQYVK